MAVKNQQNAVRDAAGLHYTQPLATDIRTRCTEFLAPVFSRIFFRWVRKVALLINSLSAILTVILKSTTWKIQSLTVDGVDQSDLFKNLTINFTDNNFTTTNGGPVWPASSTWTFVNDQATSFTRGDGLVVTIKNISNASLVLGLTWTKTTLGPGRVESISGQNVFTFVP